MTRAVIFDRDGTLIKYIPYLYKTLDVEFYPGVLDACLKLKAHNILMFIATNQSGIGRGYFLESDYLKLADYIESVFRDYGCPIQKTLFSPYHPEFGIGKYKQKTQCRKPNPGMLNQIIADYHLDPATVMMIGDSTVDIQAADNAGIQSALVRTGLGLESEKKIRPTFVADSVADVVNSYILI